MSELPAIAATLVTYSATKATPAQATVIALSGNLGAGKTTLVQALGAHLGVVETITSPTFVVMKRYDTTDELFTTLVHIDAYRIEDAQEMEVIGLQNILNQPGTLICIEWPEKIPTLIPPTAVTVLLATVDPVTRTISYE